MACRVDDLSVVLGIFPRIREVSVAPIVISTLIQDYSVSFITIHNVSPQKLTTVSSALCVA